MDEDGTTKTGLRISLYIDEEEGDYSVVMSEIASFDFADRESAIAFFNAAKNITLIDED